MWPTLFLLTPSWAEPLTTHGEETPSAPAADEQAIINGEDGYWETYSESGALLYGTGTGLNMYRVFGCSSTLIAPDVVLTAAHCLDHKVLGIPTGQDIEFRWTRETDVSEFDGYSLPEWPYDSSGVTGFAIHPDWEFDPYNPPEYSGLGLFYDIALLFLDTAYTTSTFAYLPTEEEGEQLEEDSEVTVVGWGWQDDEGRVWGKKAWGLSVVGAVSDAEFHVGPASSDVRKCYGDSGGPSFMEIETDSPVTYRLVGVTSHSYDDSGCVQTGGVDTRVDFYLDWIDEQLREGCANGTRVWCEEEGIPEPPPPPVTWEGPADPYQDISLVGCAVSPLSATWIGALSGLLLLGRRREDDAAPR